MKRILTAANKLKAMFENQSAFFDLGNDSQVTQ